MNRQIVRLVGCLLGLTLPACQQVPAIVRLDEQPPRVHTTDRHSVDHTTVPCAAEKAARRSEATPSEPEIHVASADSEFPGAPQRTSSAARQHRRTERPSGPRKAASAQPSTAAVGYSPEGDGESVEPAQHTVDRPFALGARKLLDRDDSRHQAAELSLTALQAESAEAAESASDPFRLDGSDAASEAALTLGEIEALALQRNPAIRQAAAVAQKAIGTRQQVGLRPNPTLAYTGQEIGDDGTYGQQGLQIEQIFVSGGKLELNRQVADQEVQRLLWQVEVQRQRVLTDVRRQFYATLGAQQRMALTQELEALAVEAAENFRVLFENAQGSRADLLQAEILANEISILQRQAAIDRDANWRQLASLMGVPEMPVTSLDGTLDAPGPEYEWSATVQRLLSSSPQLQQAYAEVQRARAEIRRAEVQPIPNLEMQASVMHMAESDNVGANIQLGLPIPFHNRNQGNVHRAWSELHRAQCNLQRLQNAIQAELSDAFGTYRDAAVRVAVLRDEILPRQAESVQLIELGYPAQFDFLRLFSARRSYYEARVQYLDALVALRQAEALIDGLLLTGGLTDVDDTVIDDQLRDAAMEGR